MQYAPAGVIGDAGVGVSPSLGLDLYPAAIQSSDGLQLGKVRVVGINGAAGDPDKVLVYRGGGPTPTLIAVDDVVSRTRAPDGNYQLDLADGTTIQVAKASGCGCGSSLKYFRAFPMGTYGASW